MAIAFCALTAPLIAALVQRFATGLNGIGYAKQARLHYQRALQLNPNNELAKENVQQLSGAPSAH